MTGFSGFPSGKNPYVPIPEVFFTDLLPTIEDSSELKVTLHLFWLLAQKEGNPRCVSAYEIYQDQVLIRSLKRRGDPRPTSDRIRKGLELAVMRGTFLLATLQFNPAGEQEEAMDWYFFNTRKSQKAIAELQNSSLVPAHFLLTEATSAPEKQLQSVNGAYTTPNTIVANVQVQVERPNIFSLYEQNIGLLSPLIAEELRDAAEHYPEEWIDAAFREAVQYNKRKWSYIRAILRRWETEGKA